MNLTETRTIFLVPFSVFWPNNIVKTGTRLYLSNKMAFDRWEQKFSSLLACPDCSIWGPELGDNGKMRNIKWWWEDFPMIQGFGLTEGANYWLWGKLWVVSCLAALHNNLAQKWFERVHIKTCSWRGLSILCKTSIEFNKELGGIPSYLVFLCVKICFQETLKPTNE